MTKSLLSSSVLRKTGTVTLSIKLKRHAVDKYCTE